MTSIAGDTIHAKGQDSKVMSGKKTDQQTDRADYITHLDNMVGKNKYVFHYYPPNTKEQCYRLRQHTQNKILIVKTLLLQLLLQPFYSPLSGTTQVSRDQKDKSFWIFLKQRQWAGSGISWAICKSSAPRSRQITLPTPQTFLQARCSSCYPTNSVKALNTIPKTPHPNKQEGGYWQTHAVSSQHKCTISFSTVYIRYTFHKRL